MTKKEFSDQYKHPKWQKRRLEKMKSVSDFFDSESPICEWCHNDEEQLHVHHIRYIKDRKIWEYNDDELLLLCGECHLSAHYINDQIKDLIADLSWCYDSAIAIYKVMFLLKGLGFPSIDYVADMLVDIHRINGNHEFISSYKKMLGDG